MADQQNSGNGKRNYLYRDNVEHGLRRLIKSLRDDGDDPRMFELFLAVFEINPDLLMNIVSESILHAKSKLGQDRQFGSIATLFFPIDTAMRIIARQSHFDVRFPFSSKSWNVEKLIKILCAYGAEISNLAGQNAASKNIPHRAAHILWLIDQVKSINHVRPLKFIEIGASGGFILDALHDPEKFSVWMRNMGYRNDFGYKFNGEKNLVFGIELTKPSQEWVLASISRDDLRDETDNFIRTFPRSNVVEADAVQIDTISTLREFLATEPNVTPFFYSCLTFYQLSLEAQNLIKTKIKAILKEYGGGYFLISDLAKNNGYPIENKGNVAWIEDENNRVVSPKIYAEHATLTEWRIVCPVNTVTKRMPGH